MQIFEDNFWFFFFFAVSHVVLVSLEREREFLTLFFVGENDLEYS